MDFVNDIFVPIVTSTVVTTAVSFILRTVFENRLKHHFDMELEKLRHTYTTELEEVRHKYEIEVERLRASLELTTETSKDLVTRRRSIYPGLAELIYRLRNLAREIDESPQTARTAID